MSVNKIYKKYTDPSLPGSFSGYSGFIKNNSFKNTDLVKKVIQSLPTYTLHKPIKKHFNRRPTIVRGIDDEWQVDLIDLTKESGSNSGYKYILTCIDVFSKYAWAIPMINKSADKTKDAFMHIFKDKRKPNVIYSDDGNEFKGVCKQYLTDLGILCFVTNSNKIKAAVVERFNRTLKQTIFRYFTFMKTQPKSTNLHTKRYLDVLPKIMVGYNKKWHRSIKMPPINVDTSNESIVFFNLYGFKPEEGGEAFVKVKFKVGTYVKIVNEKKLFEKGYTANWSKDIYIVTKVFAHVPLLYEVSEIGNDTPIGNYYAEHLQEVQPLFDTYEILDEDINTIKVVQLNTDNPKIQSFEKDSFLKDTEKKTYYLRSKK